MRKKKISKKNPSADSKWLLEVGVIGIDKTLKIMKIWPLSLLELEQVLRKYCQQGVTLSEKEKLPWREVPALNWQTTAMINMVLDFRLSEEAKSKLRKGRGPTSERKPLSKWILNADVLKLFRAGILDNDTERKKLDRIKTHSVVLGNALDVIEGKPGVKFECPANCYPEKVKEIINFSLSVDKLRNESSSRFRELEKKRITTRIEKIKMWLIQNKRDLWLHRGELRSLKKSLKRLCQNELKEPGNSLEKSGEIP